MTAPAPGTKEFEEVQPNRDLLFYFCVSRAPPAALLRQPAFGSALSAALLRQRNFGREPSSGHHGSAMFGSHLRLLTTMRNPTAAHLRCLSP